MQGGSWEGCVKHNEWLALDDEALEHLLVERWLFRGVLLAVMLAAAITTTYIGRQGVNTFMDQLTVGALLVIGLSSGAVAFVMRLTDMRIHKELTQRRNQQVGHLT